MKSELEFFTLCPNITEIKIQGDILNGNADLTAYVIPTETGFDKIDDTIVVSSTMTRYFQPEEYQE